MSARVVVLVPRAQDRSLSSGGEQMTAPTYKIPRYRLRLVREGTARYPVDAASNFDKLVALVRPILDPEPAEVLLCVYLGGMNQILGVQVVSRGGIAGTACTPSDVFRGAIVAGARAIALAHNHPSGDPTPSEDDIRMTRAIVAAGELLGIPLVDHVVIARDTGRGAGARSLRDLMGF